MSWKGDRLGIFSRTVFGPWLNIQTTLHDNHLLNFLLQHQRYVEDPSIDIPFIFDIDGRTLELGRQDFCLITGFRFGKISLDPKEKDRSKFRARVFPETPNLNGDHLLDLVKNDVAFNNLDDDDVVTTPNPATRGSSSSRSVHTCVRKEVGSEIADMQRRLLLLEVITKRLNNGPSKVDHNVDNNVDHNAWKRIFRKGRKRKQKTNKTEHGMEKTKPKSAKVSQNQKVNRKVNPDKAKDFQQNEGKYNLRELNIAKLKL
ncbi:hypothetical protein Tco_1121861 [Tanacetum coccineum]|uniref:Uncharacterized protein n=1 Tax=Tanacetum coccineum TaxID=301880 RepID=A0ABQ5IZB8_9ASTR